MNPLKNIRVGFKLFLGFALVLSIFMVIVLLQVRTISNLGDLQNRGVERFKQTQQVLEMDSRLEHLASITGDAIINRNMDKSEKEFREAASLADKDMKTLTGIADTAEKKTLAADFERNYHEYLGVIDKELLPYLKSGGDDWKKIQGTDERMDALGEKTMAPLDKFIAIVNAENEKEDQVYDNIANASVRTGFMLAGLGLFAAVLVAGVIGAGMAGPLRKAREYAREVAAGNIGHELAVDQGDEVGQACSALKDIVAALRTVLAEYGEVTGQISRGRLRFRGDKSKFKGAFAELIGNANQMADVMVGYLDMIPSPVMTIDNQYSIMFMNQAGAKAGGADPVRLQGTRCYDHFKTGDCQTPGCACNRAMQLEAGADSSTAAHPGGLDLEIAYSAIPIRGQDSKIIGAMEVVTDQTEIKLAQRKMQGLAQRAEGIAANVSSAAEELSAQVEQSSRGAEIQRERASETATAMEEMNSTVMEVAKNAANASQAAQSTQIKARDGARDVEHLAAAVQEIKSQMDMLSENMAGLGKQAEGISGILNVISDIADQTNLLALNAAIEAARAGDAGRGFAVVADEVRKLAEKTQNATKEVGDAITAIQERAKSSAGATLQVTQTVTDSTQAAIASGKALGDIVQLIEETVDQVRAIATAAEQQSSASEEIAKSTEEINRISSETSEAMTQSSAAIMELARLAQELNGLIAEMNS